MNWKTSKTTIETTDGRQAVEAICCGPFAIHDTLTSLKQFAGLKTLSVDGLAILERSDSERLKLLAKRLERLDWSNCAAPATFDNRLFETILEEFREAL